MPKRKLWDCWTLSRLKSSPASLETASRLLFDELVDEVTLGVAFEMHRWATQKMCIIFKGPLCCTRDAIISINTLWGQHGIVYNHLHGFKEASPMLSKYSYFVHSVLYQLSLTNDTMCTWYRMFHHLTDHGLVGFDLVRICLILQRQIWFWQKWLSSWARWWNIPSLSQPNPSPRADGTPCM